MKKKFLTALIGATIAIQSLGFSVMNVNAAVTTAPKSNTSTTTSTTVAPNPVVTTTKDVNEIDFDGTIFIENYEWSHWLGEELNLDDMKLQIAIMNKNGYYDRISDLFSYESGKFSDYYTIDTSEVDVNTPGDYKIYIESKKDAVISVNTYGNGNLPAGTYNIRLNGDKSYKNVKISESTRPTPPSMLFLNDKVNIPDKKTDSLWLSLVTDTNITAVSADPTIAEIVDVEMTEDYTYAYNVPVTHGFIKVKGLKAGETTTITAIDGKGNKASCEVYVEYTDESYPEGTMYFYSPTNCIDVYVNSIEAAFLRGYEFNGFYEIGESPITYGNLY